jgi:hypothetical protein
MIVEETAPVLFRKKEPKSVLPHGAACAAVIGPYISIGQLEGTVA